MSRWNIIRRLLKLMRPLWGIMVASVMARMLNQAAGIALVAAGIWGIGRTAFQHAQNLVLPLLGILVGIGMLKGLFRYLEQFTGHYVAFRLLGLLRNRFYEQIEPLIPAGVPDLRSGDAVSRAISDVDRVEPFYAHTIAPAVSAVFIPAAVLFYLFSMDVVLGGILLSFILIAGLGIPAFVFFGRRDTSGSVRMAAGEVNAHLTDSLQGLRDILAFGYGDHRREEIRNRGRALEQAERKQKEWRALQNGLSEAFLAGALVIILAVGTRLVHQGTMTPLTLAIAAAIGTLGLEPLIRMTDVLADFQVALASAGRLFAMMDRQPVIRDPMNPVAAGSIQPSVSFRDVTFWYPGENGNSGGRPVLEHISFTIHPGERVGLVGPSGAGKTTVVNLLLRFWDPAAGRILLGGHDLLSLSQKIIRSRIALVSQRTHIFDTTIRKNLLIGNPDASEHQVWEAVEKANLRAFIETLPHGLETSAGEMGARLSGGQRQRIAIARAFLKDAPLLVLDEATSNLDTGNERTIQQTLTRLMHDRTTLIIAHRLTTVRDADRILVLKEGHVTQEGTHHELLRRKGTYQRLFAHQQDELDNLAFPKPAF